MTRRKLVAGNWKMNGSLAELAELDGIAAVARACPEVDVVVFPPFTLIAPAVARAPGLPIGAQDCHTAPKGPHTGCISAGMVKEAGATHVIVGHSERRTDCHETNAQVRAKAEMALAAGLFTIVCVGETEAERDAGAARAVVEAQLDGSVPPGATAAALAIGYEPVWAVGTGRTPSLADIAEMHAAIREKLKAVLGNEAEGVRILYGGSVKPENARNIMQVMNVDGALVGGASLNSDQFSLIITSAD